MLDRTTYRDAFHRNVSALAAAAAQGLDAPLPSCPGWRVATLLSHLTADVFGRRIVRLRSWPDSPSVEQYEDLGLPSRFKAWFEAFSADEFYAGTPPDGLLELFVQTADALESLLYEADPEQPIYTWWPPQQNVGFLQRRMAIEAAIHRWDTQLAHGVPEPIEPVLASDGIDEMLDVMLQARRGWAEHPRQGSGETYHFHRTDGPGEWLVRFTPEQPVVTREHAKGDVAMRGSASDLLLFLWHRIAAERLEVFGDASLLERYFKLVPWD